jgi:hypothetical protein
MIGGELLTYVIHEKIRQSHEGVFRDLMMVSPPMDAHLIQDERIIRDAAKNTLTALECSDTTFHIEFRVGGPGSYIPIDVALRPGGGFICESTRCRSGIDLRLEHVFIQAMGMPRTLSVRRPDCAVAIGAFYWRRELGDVNFERLLQIKSTLAAAPELKAYHLLTEVTDSEYVRPDGGLSLCVAAQDSETAVREIRALAFSCGFS